MKPTINRKLLMSLGWWEGEGHYDICRGCHRRVGFQYVWRSPKYTAYHEQCLEKSSRYANIVKKYKSYKSQTPSNKSPKYIIRFTGK